MKSCLLSIPEQVVIMKGCSGDTERSVRELAAYACHIELALQGGLGVQGNNECGLA